MAQTRTTGGTTATIDHVAIYAGNHMQYAAATRWLRS